MKKTIFSVASLRAMRDISIDIVVVIVLALLIRGFLFAPFKVNGPSMCDTLNNYDGTCVNGEGEFLITSKLSTWSIFGFSLEKIDRGDVIVFQAPYSKKGEFYVKRVIGMPGEKIKIANGKVYIHVNGVFKELPEDYLNLTNKDNTQNHRTLSQVYSVPENSYFVMGDNRTRSSDSRRCFEQMGCNGKNSPYLSKDMIVGTAKVVSFPIDHFRLIKDHHYEM